MSIFSGITMSLNEEHTGFELNIAEVKMEFTNSFEVLNTTAKDFDQFCTAVDRLSALQQKIVEHNGKADKGLIMFLNQNNDLAQILGVDLSMEGWDDAVKGTEINGAVSTAMEGMWEAIKGFFKKIFDGISSFFTWIGSFFGSTEKKLDEVANNPNATAAAKADTSKDTAQKAIYPGAANGTCCIMKQSLLGKLQILDGFFKASDKILQATDAKTVIAVISGKEPVNRDISEYATRLGIELDKDGNPTGSKPMFSANEFAMADSKGKAFEAAGWTDISANARELKDVLAKVRVMAKSIENGKKLTQQFANMKETDFNKDKVGGATLNAAKTAGKWFIRASSVIGTYVKAIDCVATDFRHAAAGQMKAKGDANKAAAAAQKTADAAKDAAANV